MGLQGVGLFLKVLVGHGRKVGANGGLGAVEGGAENDWEAHSGPNPGVPAARALPAMLTQLRWGSHRRHSAVKRGRARSPYVFYIALADRIGQLSTSRPYCLWKRAGVGRAVDVRRLAALCAAQLLGGKSAAVFGPQLLGGDGAALFRAVALNLRPGPGSAADGGAPGGAGHGGEAGARVAGDEACREAAIQLACTVLGGLQGRDPLVLHQASESGALALALGHVIAGPRGWPGAGAAGAAAGNAGCAAVAAVAAGGALAACGLLGLLAEQGAAPGLQAAAVRSLAEAHAAAGPPHGDGRGPPASTPTASHDAAASAAVHARFAAAVCVLRSAVADHPPRAPPAQQGQQGRGPPRLHAALAKALLEAGALSSEALLPSLGLSCSAGAAGDDGAQEQEEPGADEARCAVACACVRLLAVAATAAPGMGAAGEAPACLGAKAEAGGVPAAALELLAGASAWVAGALHRGGTGGSAAAALAGTEALLCSGVVWRGQEAGLQLAAEALRRAGALEALAGAAAGALLLGPPNSVGLAAAGRGGVSWAALSFEEAARACRALGSAVAAGSSQPTEPEAPSAAGLAAALLPHVSQAATVAAAGPQHQQQQTWPGEGAPPSWAAGCLLAAAFVAAAGPGCIASQRLLECGLPAALPLLLAPACARLLGPAAAAGASAAWGADVAVVAHMARPARPEVVAQVSAALSELLGAGLAAPPRGPQGSEVLLSAAVAAARALLLSPSGGQGAGLVISTHAAEALARAGAWPRLAGALEQCLRQMPQERPQGADPLLPALCSLVADLSVARPASAEAAEAGPGPPAAAAAGQAPTEAAATAAVAKLLRLAAAALAARLVSLPPPPAQQQPAASGAVALRGRVEAATLALVSACRALQRTGASHANGLPVVSPSVQVRQLRRSVPSAGSGGSLAHAPCPQAAPWLLPSQPPATHDWLPLPRPPGRPCPCSGPTQPADCPLPLPLGAQVAGGADRVDGMQPRAARAAP
jgi:hypothetical protein